MRLLAFILVLAVGFDARADGVHRPSSMDVPPVSDADSAEFAALSIGFVAALFSRNCPYVAHKVGFPAVMGGKLAITVDDLIPSEDCDRDALDTDPLQVLADQDLLPDGFVVEPYRVWAATRPGSPFEALV